MWYEGMLLSPQHFQQNNQYLEQLMVHQVQRSSPFFYGCLALKIDVSMLSEKKVFINHVHAVMTDGTVVYFNDSDKSSEQQSLLMCDLSKIADLKPQQHVFIHLALANENGACASDEATTKRYQSIRSGKVVDQNDANNFIEMARLQNQITLMADGDTLANYSHFPVAEFIYNSDGSFTHVPYSPAMLTLPITAINTAASSDLGEKIYEKIIHLRARAAEQRNYFFDKTSSAEPLTLTQQLKLHHLSQHLPGMEVMLKSNASHPYDVYLALVNLIAGMSMLIGGDLPQQYSTYNHQQLDKTFCNVLGDIDKVLKQMALNFTVDEMELSTTLNEFRHVYHQPNDGSELLLIFKVAQGVTREQTLKWVNRAYICTENNLNTLSLNRVIGAVREEQEKFPKFQLETSGNEIFISIKGAEQYLTNDETLFITCSERKIEQYRPEGISIIRCRQESE